MIINLKLHILTVSILILLTLFSASGWSKETSFTWKGTVPKLQSPVIIKNINGQLQINHWVIEDKKTQDKYNNKYGVVKIFTVAI
jgi:hypothetical protein